jgi:hypothetical protein
MVIAYDSGVDCPSILMSSMITHCGALRTLRRDWVTARVTVLQTTVMASLLILLLLPHDGLAQDAVAVHVFTRHAALSDSDQIARDAAVKGAKRQLGAARDRSTSSPEQPVRVVAAAEQALVLVELLSVDAVVEPLTSSKARMYGRATVAAGRTKAELRAVSRRSYIQPEYELGAYEVGVRIADLVRDWIEKNRKRLVGEFIEMPSRK